MEILALSDIHAEWSKFLPHRLPPADLVLIAGDITESGMIHPTEIIQATRWFAELGTRYPRVLWIPGNHDVGVRRDTFNVPDTVTCILDRTVTYSAGIQTLTVHGTSLSPAYDAPELTSIFDYMTIDPEAERRAYDFEPVDIVLSHCPPRGMRDTLPDHLHASGSAAIGSQCLADYVKRYEPRLVVCGHVHEAHGQMQVGPTTILNTAKHVQLIHL